MAQQTSLTFTVGAEGEAHLSFSRDSLTLQYSGPNEHSLYLALQTYPETNAPEDSFPLFDGSPIVPYTQGHEGSTVFLPFPANYLFTLANGKVLCRQRKDLAWTDASETAFAKANPAATGLSFTVLFESLGYPDNYHLCAYIKDIRSDNGWGWFLGCNDPALRPGFGDKAIKSFYSISNASVAPQSDQQARFGSTRRERIYELFVRLFSNTNERRTPNGTRAENGCGTFSDITDQAIASIAAMGFTHIWLMGIIRHATTTSYNIPGMEADKTDLMKGLAGSPYAVKDYFDVAPDLATEPANRLEELSSLVARIHSAGLQVLIDLVGNHVSRAYGSQVRPDLAFGDHDNHAALFSPSNNFFYLQPSENDGPPLRLPTFNRNTHQAISPTCIVTQDCDGLFDGETTFGRVTGNNAVTWSPSLNDWYETVKLNYGYDFTGNTNPARHFPHSHHSDISIPDTWKKMDAVLSHWQALGIDGFRCDMAHMIPPEFWSWSIARARRRNPAVLFMAEAYNDSLVVETSAPEVLALHDRPLFYGLLHAGFNAVYGHDAYRTIKNLYDGSNWANDIDRVIGPGFISDHSVVYAENHDEIRLASPYGWGNLGWQVGIPASAVLFTIGHGPVLFYNGQEVGEPAVDAEGFSGADGRTTIYDYWSMPEVCKWSNGDCFDGGQLSIEQRKLRDTYSRLITLSGEEVFRSGDFLSLNAFNIHNPAYGRLPGEAASGHWLYSFLRFHLPSSQRVLVLANFHPSQTFPQVSLSFPPEALPFLNCKSGATLAFTDRLLQSKTTAMWNSGEHSVQIDSLPPLSAFIFSITQTESETQP